MTTLSKKDKQWVTNPKTGRNILVNGPTWSKLSPTSQRKSLRKSLSLQKNENCKNNKTFDANINVKDIPKDRYIKLSNGYCFDIKELIDYVNQPGFSNRNPHDSKSLLFELNKDNQILSSHKDPNLKKATYSFFESKMKNVGKIAKKTVEKKYKNCKTDSSLVTIDLLDNWEELPLSRVIRFDNGYCYDIAFLVVNLTSNFNSLNSNEPKPVFPKDPFTNVEFTFDEIKMIKIQAEKLKIIPKFSSLNVFLNENELWKKPSQGEYFDWILTFKEYAKTKYKMRIQYHGVDSQSNFTGRWVSANEKKTTFEILKDMYLDTDIYQSWNEDVHNAMYFFGTWTRLFNNQKIIRNLEFLIETYKKDTNNSNKKRIKEFILYDFIQNIQFILGKYIKDFDSYKEKEKEKMQKELIEQYTFMVDMYLNDTSLTAIKLIETIGNKIRNNEEEYDYALIVKNLPSLKKN